jgi:hypothetical protein
MTASANLQGTRIQLSRLGLRDPWSGFLLKISGFPTPVTELAGAREFLKKVMTLLLKRDGGVVETFIQFTQLHVGDGARRFADRARGWLPRQGLGVWPDREPPHSWTIEELRDLLPDEKIRPLMDIVLRICSHGKEEEARDAMLGIGTVLQFVVPDREAFISAARNLLLPPITDPSYKCFAFYVPMLQTASIMANERQLETWMCGARVYIRESPEDQGILMLARAPLDDVLLQSGAIRASSQDDEWSVPVDGSSD